TGTITRGKPELTDVIVAARARDTVDAALDERVLLELVAGAESVSEHPLARALVAGAAARGGAPPAPVEAFAAVPGGGVAARVAGHDVLVGTRQLLAARGMSMRDDTADWELSMQRLERAGKTAMGVAIDGGLAGVLGVADTVKVGSGEAISRLQA